MALNVCYSHLVTWVHLDLGVTGCTLAGRQAPGDRSWWSGILAEL
jgi:hypothetical protein